MSLSVGGDKKDLDPVTVRFIKESDTRILDVLSLDCFVNNKIIELSHTSIYE